MRLFNTLTRSLEEINPINPPNISLYACGLTVYDYTHLGHLRKYSFDDVLVKTLRTAGFQVKFVQNVTDVGHLVSDEDTGDDKLEKGAKKYGKSVWDIAREFEDYFFYSMDAMGAVRPDVSCRATEHIEAQLALVLELEKRGFTYVIPNDGVYFNTLKFPEYGKLALLQLDQLQAGARVDVVEGKQHPTDFALWKFERPGENRAMVWESPWHPRSFPGWHIECSAMAMQYLGPQLDIHTGGIDHIPVHHTNEIAQAEAATDKKPFVKYWVHHNHLQVDGQKMSKSLGNFYTIDDVLARGFHPRALRLLFLTSHYRDEQNFTWESLAGVQKQYERLVSTMSQLREERERTVLSPDKLAKVDEYRSRFRAALERDLATAEAVAVMNEVLKSNIPGPDKYDLVLEFDEVLGLALREDGEVKLTGKEPRTIALSSVKVLQDTDPTIPAEVRELLNTRRAAREAQNWSESDRLRAELASRGWIVKDEASGQTVTQQPS